MSGFTPSILANCETKQRLKVFHASSNSARSEWLSWCLRARITYLGGDHRKWVGAYYRSRRLQGSDNCDHPWPHLKGSFCINREAAWFGIGNKRPPLLCRCGSKWPEKYFAVIALRCRGRIQKLKTFAPSPSSSWRGIYSPSKFSGRWYKSRF